MSTPFGKMHWLKFHEGKNSGYPKIQTIIELKFDNNFVRF